MDQEYKKSLIEKLKDLIESFALSDAAIDSSGNSLITDMEKEGDRNLNLLYVKLIENYEQGIRDETIKSPEDFFSRQLKINFVKYYRFLTEFIKEKKTAIIDISNETLNEMKNNNYPLKDKLEILLFILKQYHDAGENGNVTVEEIMAKFGGGDTLNVLFSNFDRRTKDSCWQFNNYKFFCEEQKPEGRCVFGSPHSSSCTIRDKYLLEMFEKVYSDIINFEKQEIELDGIKSTVSVPIGINKSGGSFHTIEQKIKTLINDPNLTDEQIIYTLIDIREKYPDIKFELPTKIFDLDKEQLYKILLTYILFLIISLTQQKGIFKSTLTQKDLHDIITTMNNNDDITTKMKRVEDILLTNQGKTMIKGSQLDSITNMSQQKIQDNLPLTRVLGLLISYTFSDDNIMKTAASSILTNPSILEINIPEQKNLSSIEPSIQSKQLNKFHGCALWNEPTSNQSRTFTHTYYREKGKEHTKVDICGIIYGQKNTELLNHIKNKIIDDITIPKLVKLLRHPILGEPGEEFINKIESVIKQTINSVSDDEIIKTGLDAEKVGLALVLYAPYNRKLAIITIGADVLLIDGNEIKTTQIQNTDSLGQSNEHSPREFFYHKTLEPDIRYNLMITPNKPDEINEMFKNVNPFESRITCKELEETKLVKYITMQTKDTILLLRPSATSTDGDMLYKKEDELFKKIIRLQQVDENAPCIYLISNEGLGREIGESTSIYVGSLIQKYDVQQKKYTDKKLVTLFNKPTNIIKEKQSESSSNLFNTSIFKNEHYKDINNQPIGKIIGFQNSSSIPEIKHYFLKITDKLFVELNDSKNIIKQKYILSFPDLKPPVSFELEYGSLHAQSFTNCTEEDLKSNMSDLISQYQNLNKNLLL